MQSLRDLKKRIRTVGNIEQITKAMEVVSMNKMRRSQQFALSARPYAVASLELLQNLLKMTSSDSDIPKLLQDRVVNKKLLVVITADKGLAGAFNENVLRKAAIWITEQTENNYSVLAVGKKAKDFFERKGINLVDSFYNFGDYTHVHETTPVAEKIMSGFLSEEWDSVEVIYTHFRTTLRQETVHKKILPVTLKGLEDVIEGIIPEYGKFHETEISRIEAENHFNYEYLFEPNPVDILNVLIPSLLKTHIHHIILESNASEHSARMVAMKNASENADELGGELTLSYNKARQAGITAELSEIIAGQESVGHN